MLDVVVVPVHEHLRARSQTGMKSASGSGTVRSRTATTRDVLVSAPSAAVFIITRTLITARHCHSVALGPGGGVMTRKQKQCLQKGTIAKP